MTQPVLNTYELMTVAPVKNVPSVILRNRDAYVVDQKAVKIGYPLCNDCIHNERLCADIETPLLNEVAPDGQVVTKNHFVKAMPLSVAKLDGRNCAFRSTGWDLDVNSETARTNLQNAVNTGRMNYLRSMAGEPTAAQIATFNKIVQMKENGTANLSGIVIPPGSPYAPSFGQIQG